MSEEFILPDNDPFAPTSQRTRDVMSMTELTAKYAVISGETERMNEMASQLRAALHLRSSMESCIMRENVPIRCKLKVVSLFDESFLAELEIINKGENSLNEWTLLLVFRPLFNDKGKDMPLSSSFSFCIPSLPPSSSHSFSFHSLYPPSQWPIILDLSLSRTFIITSSASYAIQVSLEPILLSHLCLFTSCSTVKMPMKSECIVVPLEFFERSLQTMITIGKGRILGTVVGVTMDKRDSNCTIRVHSSSSSLRRSILSSILSLSLMRGRRDCGRMDGIQSFPSFISLQSLFISTFYNK